IERTHSGLAHARAAGKRFGRPPALSDEQKQAVLERIDAGASISSIARDFDTTRQTILRVKASRPAGDTP
ncbi:helix-turn-helix domain-containing protein, partial [Pantoea agglomerans]